VRKEENNDLQTRTDETLLCCRTDVKLLHYISQYITSEVAKFLF